MKQSSVPVGNAPNCIGLRKSLHRKKQYITFTYTWFKKIDNRKLWNFFGDFQMIRTRLKWKKKILKVLMSSNHLESWIVISLYNQSRNILRISPISSFFENWSSGEKVEFGLSLKCNRIIQFGRGSQTSRPYSEPYWTIFELLDPQILSS